VHTFDDTLTAIMFFCLYSLTIEIIKVFLSNKQIHKCTVWPQCSFV